MEGKTYIANAFSVQMLKGSARLKFCRAEPALVADILRRNPFVSAIGHADTARVVSDLLGVEVPANRASITLSREDFLVVAQYTGPRLPEGATTLPEGAKIEFWTVWYE